MVPVRVSAVEVDELGEVTVAPAGDLPDAVAVLVDDAGVAVGLADRCRPRPCRS